MDLEREFDRVPCELRRCRPVENGAYICVIDGSGTDFQTKAKGIARGLGCLHENGIVHSDLKGVSKVFYQ